jgi:hypothetical protein
LGVNNGKSGYCCSSACTFLPATAICKTVTYDPTSCDLPDYCTGTSSGCPDIVQCPVCENDCSGNGQCTYTPDYQSVCACNANWTGADCSTPMCELFTTCGDCGSYSGMFSIILLILFRMWMVLRNSNVYAWQYFFSFCC